MTRANAPLYVDHWTDIINGTHGLLWVLGYIVPSRFEKQGASKGKRGYWLARCRGASRHCGAWVQVSTADLRSGKVQSCEGCSPRFRDEIWEAEYRLTDEVRLTWTRNSFYSMRRRVRDKSPGYENVKVCPQWSEPDGFQQFVRDMGPRRYRYLSLHRIDSHGDYSPENCMWADQARQSRQKTNSRVLTMPDGDEVNLCDLASMLGKPMNVTSRRINRLVDSGFTEAGAVELLWAERSRRATA